MSTLLWLTFFVIQIFFNFVSSQHRTNDIEIRSLTGEPNYKSVNLTWIVESDTNTTEPQKKNGFTIHYCELQTWGSHRCKTKTLKDNEIDVDDDQKQYSILIDNLRMATKYSFHVKASNRFGEQRATGRADLSGNELSSDWFGEKIIVPTKGFSAQATKCLPHASEIEIETGPFFGGIIMTENNDNCRIQGDQRSDQERYVMRIDHEKCGSKVDHETLTVKTFITVQENLGIFTHSTRRFVVMCSYQPDTLTVRASFSVPSKSGASLTAKDSETSDRESRRRSFRMVGKEALLLKKDSTFENFPEEQIGNNPNDFNGDVSEVLKLKVINGNDDLKQINSTYDRLVYDTQLPGNQKPSGAGSTVLIVLLTMSLVIIAAFICLVGRKVYKRRLVET